MFDALVTLYHSKSINKKMLLRNKLRATQMSKIDIIAAYLMKNTKLCAQLAVVGEELKGEELAPIALNVFSSFWQSFCPWGQCLEKASHF